MSQPEDQLARKIIQYLDHGTGRIDAATRERLATARHAALARHRARTEPVLGLARAGRIAGWVAEHRISSASLLAAAAALVIAVTGIVYWQSMSSPNDIADIDMRLLTDELPINAYLDKGFDSWLKRSPH